MADYDLQFEGVEYQDLQVIDRLGPFGKKEHALELTVLVRRAYAGETTSRVQFATVGKYEAILRLSKNENESREIPLQLQGVLLPPESKKPVVLSAKVDPEDLEALNNWRGGNELVVGFNVHGYATVVSGSSENHTLHFQFSNESLPFKSRPRLSDDDIRQKLLVGAKLEERYVVSLPLEPPHGVNITDADLSAWYQTLSTSQSGLKTAVQMIREARDIKDYRAAMSQARAAIDGVRGTWPQGNIPALAQKLLVDTGIFTDAGAQESAEDFLANVKMGLDSAFGITSKAPHGRTNRGNLSFRFNPHELEAKVGIVTALMDVDSLMDLIARHSTM